MTDAPWVDGRTFGEVLRRTVERFGDRDAVVFPQLDLRWSFAEFERRVHATAKSLMALRIGKGDHVGVWATNWPEWILLQFATAHLGAVLVNVNPAYRTHEFAYILKQADLKALFITDKHKTSDYERMTAELLPPLTTGPAGKRVASAEFPQLHHVVSIKPQTGLAGALDWSSFLAQGARVPDERLAKLSTAVRPADPVNIQYTSGTTGNPKGAMLSHRNLLMNAYYVGRRQRITERDRVCIPVPFYHCFGCVMGTLLCTEYGAAMVVPAESFEAEATLAAVAAERCTALYGVPTMFNAEVNHPDFERYDLGSLRTGIMAGSPCPIELMKRVVNEMHCTEITIAYGQTEASPVVTQSETTDALDVRVSTVGSALPGVEARIVDPATGRDCAPGEQGELWARGHGIMLGYYNLPEATAAAIDAEGWLHSGDLAVRTPEGHYKITGRIKDMIIRGGENIYPREIEEFLLTHPKIRDAQVVGVPDEKFGEQASAWIVLQEPGALTADEVKAFCRARIAHYKVPHYVVFVDEFPLTVTGKVQKFRLRDMGIERFGLTEAAAIRTA
jgi:fatty-acyl-CoA synthase